MINVYIVHTYPTTLTKITLSLCGNSAFGEGPVYTSPLLPSRMFQPLSSFLLRTRFAAAAIAATSLLCKYGTYVHILCGNA